MASKGIGAGGQRQGARGSEAASLRRREQSSCAFKGRQASADVGRLCATHAGVSALAHRMTSLDGPELSLSLLLPHWPLATRGTTLDGRGRELEVGITATGSGLA